jgi:hypothetical protein
VNPCSTLNQIFQKKLLILICIALLAIFTASCYRFPKGDPIPDDGYDPTNPADVVRMDYMLWLEEEYTDYTLSMKVIKSEVDELETGRQIENYTGSEFAKSRGWTDAYLAEHFVVVKVRYECELDHRKTSIPDGLLESYVFLERNPKDGFWFIVDRTSPVAVLE